MDLAELLPDAAVCVHPDRLLDKLELVTVLVIDVDFDDVGHFPGDALGW